MPYLCFPSTGVIRRVTLAEQFDVQPNPLPTKGALLYCINMILVSYIDIGRCGMSANETTLHPILI